MVVPSRIIDTDFKNRMGDRRTIIEVLDTPVCRETLSCSACCAMRLETTRFIFVSLPPPVLAESRAFTFQRI